MVDNGKNEVILDKIKTYKNIKIISKIISNKHGVIIAKNSVFLKDKIISNGKFKYIDPTAFNLN